MIDAELLSQTAKKLARENIITADHASVFIANAQVVADAYNDTVNAHSRDGETKSKK